MDSYVDYGKLSDGQVTVYAAIAECAQEGERQAEYISLAGMDAEEIRTVVMASRSDTPNIVGSFLLPENRRKFRDKEGKAYEEL